MLNKYQEEIRLYSKRLYKERKANGLCYKCGEKAETGRVACSTCSKNKKEQYYKRKKDGVCVSCGKVPSVENHINCFNCLKSSRLRKGNFRKRRERSGVCTRCGKSPLWENTKRCFGCLEEKRKEDRGLRVEIIRVYGGQCACCMESRIEFLCIDHINGNGAEHRRNETGGTGVNTYRWLRKNNYPEGFQILCWNCNSAKHFNKICPHQRDKINFKELLLGVA